MTNFSFILTSNKWSYFMICCFLCILGAVEKFTGIRRSNEAFNVTESKTWESSKWEVWEFGNESLMRAWSNQRNESEKRKWEKRNERNKMRVCSNSELLGNIISQKPCCNNSCQVAVLVEIVWMANSIAAYSKRNECSVRFRVPWE